MAYAAPTTSVDPTNVMGRRIAAWFIDIFVPLVIAFAVGWIVFVGSATKVTNVPTDYCNGVRIRTTDTTCVPVGNDAYVAPTSDAHHAFAVGGLIYLVGAANLFLLQGLTGAALGKHMLGLRVVRSDGSIAGFGANAVRTLLLLVDQFFCALPGIITASVTHPHRRVGDFAAGTFVVARESVGRPIGSPQAAYPPPWAPPGGATGWGPPPASSQGGWTPTAAPPPGWGQPESAPPASSAPPTWGSPAANPPASSTPGHWGTPAPVAQEPAAQPAPTPAATPEPIPVAEVATPVAQESEVSTSAAESETADAPGWAAPGPVASPAPEPTPSPQPQPEPTPAQAQAAAPSREPQWDAQRNAWVYWEAETNRWLQHDPATGNWGPLR